MNDTNNSGSVSSPIGVPTLLANPDDEPTAVQLLEMFKGWKERIESEEIAKFQEEKDKIFIIYKRQKAMYDGWLAKRSRDMKYWDGKINERRKFIQNTIDKEIIRLEASASMATISGSFVSTDGVQSGGPIYSIDANSS
jgi:hypothetical protein